jgi:ABC-2 type transport system permease protein
VRAAVAIALKELRQRLRDRSAIVIAFVVPFGLAAIFSLTLANVDEESEFTATYAVADLDGGPLADAFRSTLAELDFATIRQVGTREAADELTDDGTVSAAFVVPEGFSAAVRSGEAAELEVITDPDASVAGAIARSVAGSFASELNSVNASVTLALRGGGHDPSEAQTIVDRAADVPATAVLREDVTESRLLTSTTFYAIGMAVFFVFFTVEFGARGILEERQAGTLARLLVAPVRPAWVIAGKTLGGFVVGIVSMSALVVATTLLLDADWGDPLGVAVLVFGGVLSAMGLSALVTTLARTPAQASSYASVAAVVLGMLGGTFFPTSQGPALLRALSLLAPQAWLMRGFQDLAGGGSLADIWASLLAVLTFAVVLGGIAARRAGRLVPR